MLCVAVTLSSIMTVTVSKTPAHHAMCQTQTCPWCHHFTAIDHSCCSAASPPSCYSWSQLHCQWLWCLNGRHWWGGGCELCWEKPDVTVSNIEIERCECWIPWHWHWPQSWPCCQWCCSSKTPACHARCQTLLYVIISPSNGKPNVTVSNRDTDLIQNVQSALIVKTVEWLMRQTGTTSNNTNCMLTQQNVKDQSVILIEPNIVGAADAALYFQHQAVPSDHLSLPTWY